MMQLLTGAYLLHQIVVFVRIVVTHLILHWSGPTTNTERGRESMLFVHLSFLNSAIEFLTPSIVLRSGHGVNKIASIKW